MKRFREFLIERNTQLLYHNSLEIPMRVYPKAIKSFSGMENPSVREIVANMYQGKKKASYNDIRFVITDTGKMYAWNSSEHVLHYEFLKGEGLITVDGGRHPNPDEFKKFTAGTIESGEPAETFTGTNYDEMYMYIDIYVNEALGASKSKAMALKSPTMKRLIKLQNVDVETGTSIRDYDKGPR